jgi:hypothetical protein
MVFKWSINVGKGKNKGAGYNYLTNFYTARVSGTSVSPNAVLDEADADRVIHEMGAHGLINVVIPDNAPNALHVIRMLLSVVKQEPILALNVYLEQYGEDGGFLSNKKSLFLHDVSLMHLVSTYGGGQRDDGRFDNSMTAVFQGVFGQIQNIGGNTGV